MPLVKVKEKYQVTIPASIREQLSLNVGDMLEAELEDNRIVLKPKVLIDKSKAIDKFFAILQQGREATEHFSDEEVIRDTLEAIQEVRRQKHAKRRA
jgi:AbrB family looped-hinge helix DNA binding protein